MLFEPFRRVVTLSRVISPSSGDIYRLLGVAQSACGLLVFRQRALNVSLPG
jgi:hypothetical protein